MNDVTIHRLQPGDKAEWRALFNGYAAFYQVPMTDDVADRTFAWLLAPDHVLEGLLARNAHRQAVGLAHIRECPASLRGNYVGFLDDLFVVPEARGTGVADALFEAMAALADERNWSTIRWITQHFNERGRAFYDRYTGGPSDSIMYQWTPRDA